MMTEAKTQGQLAYEEDIRREPFYANAYGRILRPAWSEFKPEGVEAWSWERNPTTRAKALTSSEQIAMSLQAKRVLADTVAQGWITLDAARELAATHGTLSVDCEDAEGFARALRWLAGPAPRKGA